MSDKGEQMSSILDDAREKIKDMIQVGCLQIENRDKPIGELILAISGTTDIECPKCGGDGIILERCGDSSYNSKSCQSCGGGTIKYKWKVSVVLENGDLPKVSKYEVAEYLKKECGFSDIFIGCVRSGIADFVNARLKLKANEIG